MTERAEDLQLEALRAFMLLSALRREWAGALVLGCGLDAGGQALSIAANIAGAGCLMIEPRADLGRAALRTGACDFVVNTVDEALRVLKNEIRQRRPVSVGLTLGWAEALEELVERGVLPELFVARQNDAAIDEAARTFVEWGTVVVGAEGTASLEGYLRNGQLRMESFAFGTAEELKALDARLAELIPVGDARRRWCASAARFFHRERPYRRVAYLTAAERALVQ